MTTLIRGGTIVNADRAFRADVLCVGDRIAAVGSAMPWPTMSGAEPCTGSNIDGLAPEASMLPDAARPIPPVTAPERSVMMSPKRLSVTITS